MERETDKVIVIEDGGDRASGTGSNAIWAIALIVIVAIIGGAVYYSGILKTKPSSQKQGVEINVSAPAAAPAR